MAGCSSVPVFQIMNPIYKCSLVLGLIVTGGGVVMNGGQNGESLKRLAAPLFEEDKSIRRLEELSPAELAQLPIGVERIEHQR